MSTSANKRGLLRDNGRFMVLQEKYMARNTSNNNSDAAPGTNRNVNYMPMVLGNTGPVRGTRRLRYINSRHLSNKNKKKSNNIVRRRGEKTLRRLRRLPVRAQLSVAAPRYTPAAPTYSYNNDREKVGNSRNIDSYDPASWYTPNLGRNLPESVSAREEAKRHQNENEEYARKTREQELMHSYYP